MTNTIKRFELTPGRMRKIDRSNEITSNYIKEVIAEPILVVSECKCEDEPINKVTISNDVVTQIVEHIVLKHADASCKGGAVSTSKRICLTLQTLKLPSLVSLNQCARCEQDNTVFEEILRDAKIRRMN